MCVHQGQIELIWHKCDRKLLSLLCKGLMQGDRNNKNIHPPGPPTLNRGYYQMEKSKAEKHILKVQPH